MNRFLKFSAVTSLNVLVLLAILTGIGLNIAVLFFTARPNNPCQLVAMSLLIASGLLILVNLVAAQYSGHTAVSDRCCPQASAPRRCSSWSQPLQVAG
jgi:hypothetical protein